ncbi:LysR family transcriptional regulator [Pseudogemmatithrix spongiicola]|uniref:LysR family transcriptional regulator n=1 Tax=Pseudogemmatithrix spongiicola TaxID=3062599 RepID=A0AA49Q7A4_9BACT|nr:LysR family transcriptional regulator [Gemmatimonadaceae bacterium 'strain 138']WKW15523.1 LysR family transcriptional regulator [Gemmatimonadaceae bacterium 'strain 318']
MESRLPTLNYHHLLYFWAVAKEGHLTRAAAHLRVSQSALSTQIRQLEARLGQPLFQRQGRQLTLTEAGRIALEYAEQIVGAGQELVATLREGREAARQVVRIGAVATLSRNFQRSFVAPLLGVPDVSLVLQSASLGELLARLRAHTLDVVLANRRVHEDAEHAWRCQRIARQQVSLVGHRRRGRAFRFPEDVGKVPLILPSRDSELRSGFDVLCERAGIRPTVVAEVDDMAMLRLLARDLQAVALVPAVVVRDELRRGTLHEYCAVPDLYEEFFAVTVRRQFAPPLVRTLLDHRIESAL